MKPIADNLTSDAQRLYARAQESLQRTLRQVLSVSREVDGEPKQLSQVELAAVTGVSRSTIIKVLSSSEESASNPDLRTLCRLAAALKLPPAFLLMTPADWTRLSGAIAGLRHIDVADVLKKPRHQLTTTELAAEALTIAERTVPPVGTDPHADDPRAAQWRQSIKAMATAPRWGAPDDSSGDEKEEGYGVVKGDVTSMFVICALMGAATRI